MTNRDFIKKFNKITMSKVCKKLNYDARSAYTFNDEKTKKIREEIESEIAKLYLKD